MPYERQQRRKGGGLRRDSRPGGRDGDRMWLSGRSGRWRLDADDVGEPGMVHGIHRLERIGQPFMNRKRPGHRGCSSVAGSRAVVKRNGNMRGVRTFLERVTLIAGMADNSGHGRKDLALPLAGGMGRQRKRGSCRSAVGWWSTGRSAYTVGAGRWLCTPTPRSCLAAVGEACNFDFRAGSSSRVDRFGALPAGA